MGKVGIELRVESLNKWSHERDLEGWTCDRAFSPEVHELVVDYEQGENCEGYLNVATSLEPGRQ